MDNMLDKPKELVSNLVNRFQEFKKASERSKETLRQNKIDINENDAYVEKGFFAFLSDLLKFKQIDIKRNELIKELWKNEELTKENLSQLLIKELDKYSRLHKDILEEKNLDKVDFEKIKKNLSNEKISELSYYLLKEKMENFKIENPHIDDIENIDKDTEFKEIENIDVSDLTKAYEAKANAINQNEKINKEIKKQNENIQNNTKRI